MPRCVQIFLSPAKFSESDQFFLQPPEFPSICAVFWVLPNFSGLVKNFFFGICLVISFFQGNYPDFLDRARYFLSSTRFYGVGPNLSKVNQNTKNPARFQRTTNLIGDKKISVRSRKSGKFPKNLQEIKYFSLDS